MMMTEITPITQQRIAELDAIREQAWNTYSTALREYETAYNALQDAKAHKRFWSGSEAFRDGMYQGVATATARRDEAFYAYEVAVNNALDALDDQSVEQAISVSGA